MPAGYMNMSSTVKQSDPGHFSKVSSYNFSDLKKYKERVYRNDKKKLP